MSQRKRKRVEEIFGWMTAYGGLRRMLVRGLARVQMHAYIVGAAYNLLRMSRIAPATGWIRPENRKWAFCFTKRRQEQQIETATADQDSVDEVKLERMSLVP